MKMIKPRMNKGVAVAALLSVCVMGWGFGASAGRTNLALKKTAIADSYDNTGGPDKAVDGQLGQGSRWENNYGSKPDSMKGNAWIYVDLGAKYLIDSVAIYWEHSASSNYVIQSWPSEVTPPSNNDTGWTILIRDTTLYYNSTMQMCLSFLKLPPTATRFVRIHSYRRLQPPSEFAWGISIMEFEVYGNPVTSVMPTVQSPIAASSLTLTKTNAGVSIKASGLNEKATADIFAPNGQAVCHLSGCHTSFWNYKDSFGRSVMNGTYLLRVTAAGKTYQDKFIVNR
jgi:hypothetical protein